MNCYALLAIGHQPAADYVSLMYHQHFNVKGNALIYSLTKFIFVEIVAYLCVAKQDNTCTKVKFTNNCNFQTICLF